MKQSLRSTHLNRKIPNKVHNQRYSVITFLPSVFLAQISQVSNLFYLIMGLSQIVPSYKVSPLISNLVPWLFVFMLYAIKEALDDFKRYKRDKEVNAELYPKLVDGTFVNVKCEELRPGDIVMIEKNQRIPADMVVFKTNSPDGQLFIRTDQLDGETDWKLRKVIIMLHKIADFRKLDKVIVEVEEPHKDIYSFFGRIGIPKEDEDISNIINGSSNMANESNNMVNGSNNIANDSNVYKNETNKTRIVDDVQSNINNFIEPKSPDYIWEPLTLDNTIWMNTVLATGNAIGHVIYTGAETRAIMNTAKPRLKFGAFEKELDSYAKFLLIMSISLSLFFTYMRGSYIRVDIPIIRYMVIFSIIIPLSLRTGIEFARYIHAYRIQNDMKGVIVRNSNIPEELGRISFLISDKTGTLTKNEMIMKKIRCFCICSFF